MGDGAGPLLRLEGVHKWFGALHVLKAVDLSVSAGEVVCIIGPSGSGKSTLLRCVNMLEEPTGGHVWFEGHDLTDVRMDLNRVRARIGIVFQAYNLFPHKTALQNVTLALQKVMGKDGDQAREIAERELGHVGLAAKADFYPSQLSGGQQQRVAIARALAMKPAMMLFDEITSALDPELVKEVLDVIRGLAREGMTMLLVTHEIPFAREVANRIVFMDEGQILEEASPSVLLTNPTHPRTRSFISKIL